MSMAEYTVHTRYEDTVIMADFRHAADNIKYLAPDGEWEPTPFSVGDTGHDPLQAGRLIYDWFGEMSGRGECGDDVISVE
jgi:hypothetical protein